MTPFLASGGKDDSHLGKWKDSLFACTRYGFFHPSFCNAIFCPQLLMAQVLTRLRMNWLGQENVPDEEWRGTFRRLLVLVSLYWTLTLLLAPPAPVLLSDPATGNVVVAPPQSTQPLLFQFLYRCIFWSFSLYTVYLLTRLRRVVRKRYEIPLQRPSSPPLLEDVCLSFWCSCCTVAQVARQTCDYEQQRPACCSKTGLGVSSHTMVV